jgi:hypothetical protein|tara:strand:+ start:36175 stop:36432 length:258 start_codon:yes stop_codon:yes gene_type:complete
MKDQTYKATAASEKQIRSLFCEKDFEPSGDLRFHAKSIEMDLHSETCSERAYQKSCERYLKQLKKELKDHKKKREREIERAFGGM